MKKLLQNPRFILPLSIAIGVLFIALRVADMWDTLSSGRLFVHQAVAEEKPSSDKAADKKPTSDKPAADKSTETKPGDAPPALTAPPDPDASPAEMDVLKQLADRREQLEKRSHDMDTRESLLKVTEQRVDQKIKEMQTLRVQLQSMVSQASESQQAQIENLVKIYETMKPDEAARILEKLDMPELLGVIQRMKPKSTAPIMAKMTPEKAKEITDAMTNQDKLPQIK